MFGLTGFGIENFRLFGEQTWFDFTSINILTGPNSSGKSSLTKAMLLINENIKKNGFPYEYLDTDFSLTNIGDYSKYLTNQENEIVFKIPFELNIITGWFLFVSYKPYKGKMVFNNIEIKGKNDICLLKITNTFQENDVDYVVYNSNIYINIRYLSASVKVNKNSKYDNSEFLFEYSTQFFDKIKNEPNIINELKLIEIESLENKMIFEPLQVFFSEHEDLSIFHEEYEILNTNLFELIKKRMPYLDIKEDDIIDSYLYNLDYFWQEHVVATIIKPFKEFISKYKINYIRPISLNNERLFTATTTNILLRENLLKLKYDIYLKKIVEEQLIIFEIGDKIEVETVESSALVAYIIKDNKRVNIADLGTGHVQILNIILALNADDSFTILEEPETFLHPALQSKLADLIVSKFSSKYTRFNNILIETHSEYLIRKMQYLIAKCELQNSEVNIFYFNKSDTRESNPELFYKIEIENNGILKRPFGTGFYDEANNLNMNLFLLTKDSQN